MTGIENWSTSERVQRYREVVEIVDQMLRQETTTYQGRYYQIIDARICPPALQKPRPPLTLAAAVRMSLKIAAQYANTWNSFGAFGSSPKETLAITHERSEMLDQYCAEIGRDPGEITRSFLVGITADTPFASVDAFYDFVGRLHEIGITEFIFYYDYPAMPSDKCLSREMLERIAIEAIPAIKQKGTS